MNGPSQAVIQGNCYASVGAATLVRDVNGAVRSNLNVAMQPATLRQVPHRDTGPEGQPAIITARGKGGADTLRGVINLIRINRMRRWRRHRTIIVGSAAYRLMVHARRLAGTLRLRPGSAVIIRKGHDA